jgi:non-canonical purine NTP pyrophosphatase (RdgB/HAM1 family)
MNQLIFSTGNDSKYTTAKEVCNKHGIELTQSALEIDEIQGEDAEKIVIDKVNKAYELVKQPVIVSDDTWLITALNGFPGSYMKSMNHWFKPQDFINLTQSLSDRSIYLVGYLAYRDGEQIKLFYQKREGILLKEPKGQHEPASHKVISMVGDNGLSIAEVYDKGLARSERDVAKIWHEFAEWFKDL